MQLQSLGKSMGIPLITKYLQKVDNKERILVSPIDDIFLKPHCSRKLESICSLVRDTRKLDYLRNHNK